MINNDFVLKMASNDKDGKSQLYLHKWLAKNKRGKATLVFIRKQFKGINLDISNLQLNLFSVSQISESDIEIQPKVNVRLCSEYVSGKQCYGDCNQLHMCKQFLFSPTSCKQINCSFSHDVGHCHNQDILQSVFQTGYDNSMQLKVLRSSFPRLCGDFRSSGNCSKPFCGYIHTCEDYAQSKCKGKSCVLETLTGRNKTNFRNFRSEHNKRVLAMFGEKYSKDEFLVNVLVKNSEETNSESIKPYQVPRPARSTSSLSDVSSIGEDNTSTLAIGENQQLYIHKWLSRNKRGKANMDFLQQQIKVFNIDVSNLQKSPLFCVSQIPESNFEIRPKVNVRLCSDYVSGKQCYGGCNQLHMCKQFLISATCCKQNNCPFSHDVGLHHNQDVLQIAFPTGYDESMQLKVLQFSFPEICKNFSTKGNCLMPFCGYFHICKAYVQGSCKGTCQLEELTGIPKATIHNFHCEHNKNVLAMFQFGEKYNKEEYVTNTLIKIENEIKPLMSVDATSLPSSNYGILQTPSALLGRPPYLSTQGVNLDNPYTTRSYQSPKAAESMPSLVPESNINTLPSKIDVLLCGQYLNGDCVSSCGCLHMCKEFLVDLKKCRGRCVFGFSHDPLDRHNKQIVHRCNPYIPAERVLGIIRKSFPKICHVCQLGPSCKKIHICDNLLQNIEICLKEDCTQCHEFDSPRNMSVYREYPSIHNLAGSIESLKVNTLYSKASTNKTNPKQGDNHALKIKIYKEIFNNDSDGFKDLGTCVDKEDIAFFETSEFFRIVKQNDKVLVYPCPTTFRPCFYHWRAKKDSCNSSVCNMVHICNKVLFNDNGCKNDKCTMNHSFQEKNVQKRIKENHLEDLSDEELKLLLSLRYPFICENYLKKQCKSADSCPNVHICAKFLKNVCKGCPMMHVKGLNSDHAKRLMKEYHIKEKDFRSCVISSKIKRRQRNRGKRNQQKSTSSAVTNNSDADDSGSDSDMSTVVGDSDGTSKQIQDDLLMYDSPLIDLTEVPIVPQSRGPDSAFSTVAVVKKKGSGRPIIPLIYQTDEPHILPTTISSTKTTNTTALKKFEDEISKNTSALSIKNDVEEAVYEKPEKSNVEIEKQAETKPIPKPRKRVSDEKMIVGKELSPEEMPKVVKKPIEEHNSRVPEELEPVVHKESIDSSERKPISLGINFADIGKLGGNEWQPPTEMDVFKMIMTSFKGSCRISCKPILKKFFTGKKSLALQWYKDHCHTFRLEQNQDKVYLCIENILPCYDYWGAGCKDETCNRFHICKQFLHNVDHSGISCDFSHQLLDSEHNRRIITNMHLEPLTLKQLIILLRHRFPLACADFLSGTCAKGAESCTDVHICGDYVNGVCTKSEGLCSFPHLTALSDVNAERFKREYHILDHETLRKCIVYFREKRQTDEQDKVYTKNVDFDFLKEEAICHKYLNGMCNADDDDDCKLLHPKSMLPYAWQFKKQDGAWRSLPAKLNEELEKCYCNPSNEHFNSSDTDPALPALSTYLEKLGLSTASYLSETVAIRRLSTKSKALQDTSESNLEYFTEWKWYWENSPTKWEEYQNKHVTSEQIEKSYLGNEATFTFAVGQYSYRLSFNNMQQQNLGPRYFTKRNVVRRPTLYKSNRSCSSPVLENMKPWYWPSGINYEGGRIDVEEGKKAEIIRQFQQSIGYNVQVLDVDEICNSEFYQRYQNKKQLFSKKLGPSNLNELSLYHGTDSTVVDGICVHNFDWRLCGKNATAFGQGSYFAKMASYSHNYTVPDASTHVRYMFIANILAGKSVVGNNSMKRPPAISSCDPNVLYDSCVNNQSSPTIYVIFERDQCYPQYLISYIDSGESIMYRNAASRKVGWATKPKPLKKPATTPRPSPSASVHQSSSSPSLSSSSTTRAGQIPPRPTSQVHLGLNQSSATPRPTFSQGYSASTQPGYNQSSTATQSSRSKIFKTPRDEKTGQCVIS